MVIHIDTTQNLTHTSTEYLKDHEVERAVVYMQDNTTETVISEVGTPVQVAGTFLYSVNDGFSEGSNSIIYSGQSMTARVVSVFSCSGHNAQDLAFYISINGSEVQDSEGFVTTDSGGKSNNVVCQTVLELANLDEISVLVENYTSTHNVTIDNMSINIMSIH